MELIGGLIAYLVFKPLISFCQAFAGILTTTDCVRLVRAQRIATGLLAVGTVAIVIAGVAYAFSTNGWFFLGALASGFVFVVTAGAIRHRVETKVKEQSP